MKRTCFTAFALALIFNATAAYAQQYPTIGGYVNDFASLLQPKDLTSLDNELRNFTRTTTHDVVILTVPYLGDKSMVQYAQGLYSEGKIGKRGVVLLVALKERTGRIHTGSDVKILTDNIARQIGEKTIAPLLSEGKMAEGVIAGTHAILRALDPNYTFISEKRIEDVETVQPTPQTQSEPLSESDNASRTADNRLLIDLFLGAIVTALAIFIATPRVKQFKARRYVLNNKHKTANALVDAAMLAQDNDVYLERRLKLEVLRRKFATINSLTSASQNVDWVSTRNVLEELHRSLSSTVMTIEMDISQAMRARRECPALKNSVPNMLKETEEKLSKGTPSLKALSHLEQARAQYGQYKQLVEIQKNLDVPMDDVTLYVLLIQIQHNLNSATLQNVMDPLPHIKPFESDYSSSGGDSSID